MADPAHPVDDVESPSEESPRLVVVDADERTRESIVGILGIRHRYDVVGSAGHVGAALALVAQLKPDVVVVDPRLPDVPDGIAFIRRVRASHPHACILAVGLSPALEHDTVVAGADGFVRKTFRPGDLAGAITRCLALHQHEGDPEAAEHGRVSSPRDHAVPPSPPSPVRAPVLTPPASVSEPPSPLSSAHAPAATPATVSEPGPGDELATPALTAQAAVSEPRPGDDLATPAPVRAPGLVL